MLDPDDSALLLEPLFFEKPNMHCVNPKPPEARLWQLEEPPSLTHIPATQDIQEEAEAITTLYKKKTFQPPFKRPGCFEALPPSKSSYRGLFGGEGFLDYPRHSCRNIRGADDTLQDFSHPATSSLLSLNCNKSPPLRKSLFKMHVLTSGGDSSKMDDLSGGGSGSQTTTSTPQTFLSQVTMTTVPPPPPPPPPEATVGHAAPPLPSKPPRSTPPLGSSAASGRPSQQAPHAEMQDKGTKRAFVPPMTPRPLHIQGSSGSGVLRPVSEIPIKFRSVFNEFPFFNYVQSKALDDVLYTNKNFVACAPTGSGKTVLFELAIIRLLMETQEPWSDVKAVYMAPIKALCSQCFESWKKKFGPFGLVCKELTGDTEIDDFFEIHDSHIILTTPEKWDSMTRRWKNNCLLQLVRLFLIDEVHVVKDATRGATLEVVVSRMKALHAYRTSQNPEAGLSVRFLAASATIPNISDIAEWLANESGPATCLDMDESHRPVKLKKVVLGFPCSANQSEFKFDLSLNYKMANIVQTYSEQKPALVFCSTRKGAQQSAAVLAKDARFIMSIEHKQRLTKYASSILDSKLKELVLLGVGYHHAGVHVSDRKTVEEAFTLGDLPVLFTTRTLAMGVNLPAHLVVIKSTTQYVAGSCEEYSEADLLQMIGRAGRPQFDTSATAVIMTKIQTKEKYSKLMSGVEIIESSLHGHLVEHLNAEIVLQTISDVSMALDWIRSTFLYIRALKNPTHYGFSADLDKCGIEAKFQELCLKNLNSLSSIGLIDMDEDINIKPSEAGRLMARYCVAFETMKQFNKVVGTENLSDLIELVSKSREFSDIQLRVNEKRSLNTLNRDKNRITIRFPMEGKIKTNEMKVNCLIQAQLGTISIQEFGLTQDTAKIFRIGMRISKCLSEFLSQRSKTGFSAVLNALILAKCFRAKLWENSPYVSKQLEKIGQSLSTAMVNAGLTTFSKIEETNPRELELILNRHPPFGNQIREAVVHLPKYDVTLEQLPRYSKHSAEILVKVSLVNQAPLLSKRTAPDHHYVSLVIGDSDNAVVFLQKLTDSVLLKSGSWSKKIDVSKASKGAEITVHLISSEYVGLDLQQKFSLYYSTAWKPENPRSTTQDPTGQKAPQPATVDQTAAETANGTYDKDPVAGNKRQCNHLCKNKELCAHDCCKLGVAVTRKRSSNQESSFTSHLKDLRSRCDSLAQTPVKRLKLKMNEEAVSVSMKEFSYKPREMLRPDSWYKQIHSLRPSAVVDLTGGDCVPDVLDMNDYDGGYDDVVDVEHQRMEESARTPASYYQNSQMWTMPQISDRSQKSKQNSHQMNATGWASSTTRLHQEALRKNASFHQAVCFELGNEWKDYGDWGDFDDEDLVHASETLSDAEPQTRRRLDYSVTGCVSSSAPPPPLSRSQAKPCYTANSTTQRSLSSTLSPDFRNLGFSPSPPSVTSPKRITLDWKKKITDIGSQQIAAKKPETQPKLTNVAQVTRKFDFFSENIPAGVISSASSRKKEEESFIGIFDGIF